MSKGSTTALPGLDVPAAQPSLRKGPHVGSRVLVLREWEAVDGPVEGVIVGIASRGPYRYHINVPALSDDYNVDTLGFDRREFDVLPPDTALFSPRVGEGDE